MGIIQTLRNAVFGENLPLPPPPLQRSVTLAICPLPLLRSEIFDPPLLIENKGNNLRYISKRCFNTQLYDFTAILLIDIVLTLPKFAKKFMIIQPLEN